MSRQLRINQFTRKKPKGPTANALTQQVLKVLTMKGYCVWRANNTGVYDPVKKVYRKFTGLRGVGDVIGYHRHTGRFISAEIKAGRDELSIWQEAFIEAVNKAGGVAVVVRSIEDLEQVA